MAKEKPKPKPKKKTAKTPPKPARKPYFRTKGPQKMRTDEDVQALAEDLAEWVKGEEACSFIGWLARTGLNYRSCDDIADKYPHFKQAKEEALFTIGYRRESKALNGEWDAGTVRKAMALYDPSMKKHELEMKGLDTLSKAAANVQAMDFKGVSGLAEENEALKKELAAIKAKLESK